MSCNRYCFTVCYGTGPCHRKYAVADAYSRVCVCVYLFKNTQCFGGTGFAAVSFGIVQPTRFLPECSGNGGGAGNVCIGCIVSVCLFQASEYCGGIRIDDSCYAFGADRLGFVQLVDLRFVLCVVHVIVLLCGSLSLCNTRGRASADRCSCSCYADPGRSSFWLEKTHLQCSNCRRVFVLHKKETLHRFPCGTADSQKQ